MEDNSVQARTCVYNVQYHVVWSVKHRCAVLTPDVAIIFKQLINEIALDKDFVIANIEIKNADHVHLLISAHPKHSISYMVKMLKGISGRKLYNQFPEIRQKLWKGQLWNHSYYVETIGTINQDNIDQYIERQQQHY